MINLDAAINSHAYDIRMLMQVHDELVFEVNAASVDDSVKLIRDKMVTAAELTIPLVVDVGVGNNWDEAH